MRDVVALLELRARSGRRRGRPTRWRTAPPGTGTRAGRPPAAACSEAWRDAVCSWRRSWVRTSPPCAVAPHAERCGRRPGAGRRGACRRRPAAEPASRPVGAAADGVAPPAVVALHDRSSRRPRGRRRSRRRSCRARSSVPSGWREHERGVGRLDELAPPGGAAWAGAAGASSRGPAAGVGCLPGRDGRGRRPTGVATAPMATTATAASAATETERSAHRRPSARRTGSLPLPNSSHRARSPATPAPPASHQRRRLCSLLPGCRAQRCRDAASACGRW